MSICVTGFFSVMTSSWRGRRAADRSAWCARFEVEVGARLPGAARGRAESPHVVRRAAPSGCEASKHPALVGAGSAERGSARPLPAWSGERSGFFGRAAAWGVAPTVLPQSAGRGSAGTPRDTTMPGVRRSDGRTDWGMIRWAGFLAFKAGKRASEAGRIACFSDGTWRGYRPENPLSCGRSCGGWPTEEA